jgi:CubicO group peptidase (beta-lactamase class C family)
MYAGYADEEKTKPYTKDNLTIIHSSGKAVMSCTIAHLVGEGKLDYDEKVSKYWPEFATGNKADVTLGQLCAHSGWLDGCLVRCWLITANENHRWRQLARRRMDSDYRRGSDGKRGLAGEADRGSTSQSERHNHQVLPW